MSIKLREIRKAIPSIEINKDFIEKFGKILEKDTSSKYNYIEYELSNNTDEVVKFSSYVHILNSGGLPKNIQNLKIRINHTDINTDVDIFVNFGKPFNPFGLIVINQEIIFSSKNEGILFLKIDEIDKLLNEYRLGYHSYFYLGNFSPFIFLSSLIFPAIALYIQFKFIFFDTNFGKILFYLSITCLFIVSNDMFRYAYPFYEFKLTRINTTRSLLRKFLLLIPVFLGGLISTAFYDYLKILVSK